MTDRAVNICMITDDNYIVPTSVAMHSAIENKKCGQYNFYIITSNLSEDSEKHFKNFETDGVSVTIVREDAEKKFGGLHNFSEDSICVASISALLKFIIPDLLKDLNKVLYLDGDIIVNSDLGELYGTDLENNFIAAVADSGTLYWTNDFIRSVQNYFNSGVMLMDLKKMRAESTSRVLIETKKNLNDSSLMDQNVFNLVFNGKVKLLPVKYNFMPLSLERAKFKWDIKGVNEKYGTNYQNESEMYLDSAIVHYSSKDKPWKYPDAAWAYLWRHYYLSLYKNEMPQRKEKYGISVIIPCYNVQNYLKETVQSVFDQTYNDLEIILIDDGSTDDTAKIIKELEQEHENISAYYNENHGQGYERNFGVTKAQGKYIHFMDSDDLLAPDCYKILYDYAVENDLDNILFEAESFYESKELEKKMPQYKNYYRRKTVFPALYNGKDLFVRLKATVGLLVSPCLQLIKREFLLNNNIEFPPLRSFEDNLFTFNTVTRSGRIAVLPNAFYLRRLRDNSTMTSSRSKEAVNALTYTVSELIKVYLRNPEHDDFSAALFKHMLLLCDVITTHYNSACKEEGKEDIIDELENSGREFMYCLYFYRAKKSGDIPAHSNAEYNSLNSQLNKANKKAAELNNKLQKTYREKSEINAKLQRTYKEKSAKTAQIKKLEKWSLYPLLRKIKRFFSRKKKTKK